MKPILRSEFHYETTWEVARKFPVRDPIFDDIFIAIGDKGSEAAKSSKSMSLFRQIKDWKQISHRCIPCIQRRDFKEGD